MHGSGWFGMGGMGLYWQIPLLVVVLVILVSAFARRRPRDDR
jgi:hypothetical protein